MTFLWHIPTRTLKYIKAVFLKRILWHCSPYRKIIFQYFTKISCSTKFIIVSDHPRNESLVTTKLNNVERILSVNFDFRSGLFISVFPFVLAHTSFITFLAKMNRIPRGHSFVFASMPAFHAVTCQHLRLDGR